MIWPIIKTHWFVTSRPFVFLPVVHGEGQDTDWPLVTGVDDHWIPRKFSAGHDNGWNPIGSFNEFNWQMFDGHVQKNSSETWDKHERSRVFEQFSIKEGQSSSWKWNQFRFRLNNQLKRLTRIDTTIMNFKMFPDIRSTWISKNLIIKT